MADEAEHGLHPGQYPWPHDGHFSSYDHASIRRGHQARFLSDSSKTLVAETGTLGHAGLPAGLRRLPLREPALLS